MSESWYYADQGLPRGPLSLEQLKQALASLPGERDVLVWHSGLSDWKKAGEVPELNQQTAIPPPLPPANSNDKSPPETHGSGAGISRASAREEKDEHLRRKPALQTEPTGKRQRRLDRWTYGIVAWGSLLWGFGIIRGANSPALYYVSSIALLIVLFAITNWVLQKTPIPRHLLPLLSISIAHCFILVLGGLTLTDPIDAVWTFCLTVILASLICWVIYAKSRGSVVTLLLYQLSLLALAGYNAVATSAVTPGEVQLIAALLFGIGASIYALNQLVSSQRATC